MASGPGSSSGGRGKGSGHVVAPGDLFHGTLQIVSCIQAGGMGAVYEVIHTPTQRRRALKLMHASLLDDANMRERFEQEATVAANVDSEHIVETIDAGIDEATGVPFILMELLKGKEVAQLLKARGRFSAREVAAVMAQVVRALELTHAAGVVHRDLKPSNLFLALRDDGTARVKILDFGVAKITEAGGASTTAAVGTPLYMAPEQAMGGSGISPRTDLYALAQVTYTLLVGKPFWAADYAAAGGFVPFVMGALTKEMEPATLRAARLDVTLPPAFDAWFAKAAARAPEARFENAREQLEALAEVLEVSNVVTGGPTREVEAMVGLVGPLMEDVRSSSPDLKPPSQSQPGAPPPVASEPSMQATTPLPRTPTSLPQVAQSDASGGGLTDAAVSSDAGLRTRSWRTPIALGSAGVGGMLLAIIWFAASGTPASHSRTPASDVAQSESAAAAKPTAVATATSSASPSASTSASTEPSAAATPAPTASAVAPPVKKPPPSSARRPARDPLDTY